jgi:hypothetical protein
MQVAGSTWPPGATTPRLSEGDAKPEATAMTRPKPKDFDPQAIPHYNAEGRLGELDPDEPEERQSSAEVGTEAEVEPGAGGRTLRDDRRRGIRHAGGDSPEPGTRRLEPRKDSTPR